MRVLTLDVETTTSNKGNPFDRRNKLVMVGFKFLDEPPMSFNILDEDEIVEMRYYIEQADVLVGFNIKFDLHWLRNIGIDCRNKRIYDVQLGEYILSRQENKYPSLDGALTRLGLPLKLDVVAKYWEQGINTDEIPTDILREYLYGDLIGTERAYLIQKEELEQQGYMPLFKLQCLDLSVLQDMEWNGIKFSTERAVQKADEISQELQSITEYITNYTNGVPINLNSDDDVSVLLYGGIIYEDVRIPIGVFKTGKKIGQTRYSIQTKEYELPRLVTPLKGTERYKKDDEKDKPRYWLTNDTVIRSLKPNKKAQEMIDNIKRYTELEKLRTTYLLGWTKLIEEMGWDRDMIHGNLNQCVVITGRLSSTKPNLQNADPQTKTFCVSRYDS